MGARDREQSWNEVITIACENSSFELEVEVGLIGRVRNGLFARNPRT